MRRFFGALRVIFRPATWPGWLLVLLTWTHRAVDTWGNVDFFWHTSWPRIEPVVTSIWFQLALTVTGLIWIGFFAFRRGGRHNSNGADSSQPRDGQARPTVGPPAIAFPLSVSMTYRDGAVAVECAVALYALERTKESPTEIALAVPGGEEICRVEFPAGCPPQGVESGGAWRIMIYRGKIVDLDRLASMVRHTRTKATVELEPRIPGGAAGAAHHDSGVQFWLPDDMSAPPRMTATIENWRLTRTSHFDTANDLLSGAFAFSNKIGVYGHASDPDAHAHKLVEPDFVRDVEQWEQNVRGFWLRARDSL